MGTVGLSFGSPTSGAGFDVSSTVAEIVGNLQNVETPWKNQLTSLESEDTVISNLGTLFSNVSNDISQLTDLQGVMAEKTGSSSDTNVLELTSASSSAVAGTYTVVVNNLAQTSSGYLAEVPDASDTIAGSFQIQVGSGAAQTITVDSSDNTLAGLAAAINSSGAGVTASVLTDAAGSRLTLASGTSGAGGNITISQNKLTAAVSNPLSATVIPGSSSVTSSALLSPVASPSEELTGAGALGVSVGGGTEQTIAMSAVKSAEGGTTLADLVSYINDPANSFGFTASTVTNSDGTTSLELTSGSPAAAGTLAVTSNLVDTATSLAYTNTETGSNASLTVDGVSLTSASNTVTNLIPGITFQLLAPSAQASGGSLEPVQVVIANDNTQVESTVNQFVSDYNSLISAINAQEGDTSSGTPEPLFGSPTLTLLQQQLLSGLNIVSPAGLLTSVPSTAGTTLSGSISLLMSGGSTATFIVGSGSDSAGTYYTDNTAAGGVNNGNTLAGLTATINAAASNPLLVFSPAAGSGTTASSGTLTAIADAQDSLGGSISIQVGSGTAQTIDMSDVKSAEGGTTLADVVSYINDPANSFGFTASTVSSGDGTSLSLTSNTAGTDGTLTVTSSLADLDTVAVAAGVTTADGQSTLTLVSQIAGSGGALSAKSSLTASTPTALDYTDAGYTAATPDTGTLGNGAAGTDALSGSVILQVGNGAAQTVTMSEVQSTEGGATLADLQNYIENNSSTLGLTATLDEAGTGLTLTSNISGAAGALTVTSNLLDPAIPTTTAMTYTASSDISSLSALGISVDGDGSLSLDVSSLDSTLNSDYGDVVGFLQDAGSWGQSFSTMLTGAGASSSSGILALASRSDSTVESQINAKISDQNSLISAQQSSLTAELNSANEIMQELPTQINGMNELYSAITGYDENLNG